MRIKTGMSELLRAVGISEKHAQAIEGQQCERVRSVVEGKITQVEFDGRLIGWKEPFVFCVPNAVLEDDAPQPPSRKEGCG
jgi:hypothetical protein